MDAVDSCSSKDHKKSNASFAHTSKMLMLNVYLSKKLTEVSSLYM